MKKTKRLLSAGIAVSLLLSAMVLFTGCGEPANLEEYIASNEEASDIIEEYNTSDATGGMTVDVKENTITYTYKYTTTYEGATLDVMKPALEDAMDNMKDSFTGIGDSLEEQSGIEDITVKVIYLNGDGSELYSAQY